jgi:hypothetical protein
MSRGMPSMTALLGMLALAGYQNRDKLIEMFNNVAGSASRPDGSAQPRAQGDLPGGLSSILGGAGVGGLLGGGLSELLEQFTKNGQGGDGGIVDRTWPQQGGFASSAQAGYRTGCLDGVGAADRALPGRASCTTDARTANGRRQIHA